MLKTITILLLFGCLYIVAISVIKRKKSIPCPWWLSFLLENPYMEWIAGSPALIKRAKLKPGMCVLDVGCGPGRLTIPFARHVGPTGKVIALDIQEKMLQKLEKRIEDNNLTNIKTVLGGTGEGKIQEENSFDRTFLVTVLGEIPDKEKALKEIYNVLRPNGILSITEVLPDPDYQRSKTVLYLSNRAGFKLIKKYGNIISFTMNFIKPVTV